MKLTSFIFCEKSIRDNSGKYTLVEIFNSINPDKVPVVMISMAVYMEVQELTQGEHPFKIEIVHKGSKPPVMNMGASGTINMLKTSSMELSTTFTPVTFPKFGEYVAKLFIDGKLLGEKVFKVQQRKEGKK